jgi:Kef-type K+ transport system membrane component KefB
MEHNVFSELSLVIVATVLVSIVMKMIKQPLILGYILAGLLVGPSGLHLIHSTELFEAFSEIGIALLLFIIGLGMHVGEFRKLGKVVFIGALSTLTFITMTGFATATVLGFGRAEAFIIGLALFFSSTIIIVKLLSDKKETTRLHGQIAIGIILLEDIIATLALLFVVAGRGGGGIDVSELLVLGAKSIFLLLFLLFCAYKVLPRVSKYIAGNQELLFLFAISWGFGIATLFSMAGFSIEIGALFAGVALSASPFVQEIASRLRPLRDFFIVLFFITLGEQMDITNIGSAIVPALIFSAVVIIGKPLVVIGATGLLGYPKRISFKTGINLSQISEFSIILAVLAVNDGIASPKVGAVITLVAIITIAVSTYLIQYDEKLFRHFDKLKINLFEKQTAFKEKKSQKTYQNVLLGYHHGGHEFMKTFQEMKKKFLVIDYDPEVIDILEHHKVDYLYGDATDVELLQEAGIERSKMVVSTIIDHDANLFIGRYLKQVNPEVLFISHAANIKEANELYEIGASYVMIPHHVGSEKMSALIKRTGGDKEAFRRHRVKHIAALASRIQELPESQKP